MILKMLKSDRHNRGIMALIATVMLATGVLAFCIATLASSVMYSDMVYRKEIRIQVGLNLRACLDTAELMLGRDDFLSGTSSIPEFGCTVHIVNDFNGNHSIDATAGLSGVKQIGHI